MIPLSHPSVHPSIVDQYSCSVAESPHWQQRSAGGDIRKRSSESRINCGEWRDWKEEWGMEGGVRLGWKVKVREKKRVRQGRAGQEGLNSIWKWRHEVEKRETVWRAEKRNEGCCCWGRLDGCSLKPPEAQQGCSVLLCETNNTVLSLHSAGPRDRKSLGT